MGTEDGGILSRHMGEEWRGDQNSLNTAFAQSMTWNIRPGWDGGLRSLSRTALLAEQTYGFSPCTDDPDELVHSDAILERAALEEGKMELRQLDWKQVPGWLSFSEWW